MSKIKVYVLGATGMLGHVVASRLSDRYDVVTPPRLDLSDPANVDALMEHVKDDGVVVNCVGLIRQRMSPEPDRSEVTVAYYLNSYLPRALAERRRLVHVSTDCVFSGRNRVSPYLESDPPDGEDVYAVTKRLGEVPQRCMVLRLSIIGPEIRNHLGLFEWFRRQTGMVRGFVDHYWNGLTTFEAARVIAQAVDEYDPGLYHVFTEEVVNKYELLRRIASVLKLDTEVVPTRTDRIYRVLSTRAPRFRVRSLDEQLSELS